VYKGKIKGVHPFGVFVEILPGAEDGSTPGLEGLCHVSELHTERIRNCENYIKSLGGDEIEVKYLGINDKGQIRLSRKEVLQDRAQEDKNGVPASVMSEDEIDVIAQAIEGLNEV
jgi:polyribonucleotide nucleotidyltransferase